MAVFEDCSVVLDLKNVPFKERRRLMTAISDNGGDIAYVVNQKCSFVVAGSVETLSSSKLRSAQKHQVPVVGVQYVWSCLDQGILLPATEHVIKPTPPEIKSEILTYPGVKTTELESRVHLQANQEETKTQFPGTYLGSFRLYKDNDRDLPDFPSSFQVAKYTIFSKTSPKTWSVLELQSAKVEGGRQYRVVKSIMRELENAIVHDAQAHSSRSEEAVEVYLMLKKQLQDEGFTETHTLPPEAEKLASPGLQQLLLEEKLNCSTVSHEVGVFVELIWKEALGSLNSILTVPITNISLNDVSRVEGLLLQVQKSQFGEKTKDLLEEVNRLLPLRMAEPESQQKLVSQKLDLCQLIRDILTIREATLGNPFLSSLGKYRALQCSIEQVPSQSPEFQTVCQLLKDKPVEIQKVLRVNRRPELHMFKEELGNIKHLFHSTRPSSCVGILSRGLLLPRVGVEQHGIERTDIGNLGGGIYFSDSLITSLKYSKPSVTDGSRLLLVCDVALGQCKDMLKRDTTLTCAPEGYNSVHGVSRTQKAHSEFEDDEYVVYSTDQVKLKYVVQYFLEEDQVKTFEPDVNMSADTVPFFTTSDLLSVNDTEGLEVTKNPLEEVTAGLLDSSGQKLPLQAVHVRCKLMDLLSQVVIFQTYTNKSTVPIEAKYVFPLEETAAVCGFEAFINGKHIIGKVKEKETARKEYRQAIEKGHGAYLMDQDAPDVFTISVGNLPPGATVLIKVTFITELVVRAGTILFSLPGSVAPWQQSAALNQTTQTTVEKVGMTELQSEGEFSLCVSIEMPYEITDLECSHRFKIKRTECKAVVSTLPDQTLGTDGFQLSFSLSEIHMPRMWVEKHPEKDSEACMLVFYPDFESSGVSSSAVSDVVILLDASESMRGQPLLNARRIALEVLHSMDRSLRVNVVIFGTDYKEAFPSLNIIEEAFEPAKKFIMTSPAVGGSTELWRPLRNLNLLPPSHGVRNVLLLSDGHVQNQPQTLQLVRDNVQHTRLFTCGLSPTANRHMLRALAQAGGGSHEFFDTKSKHTWSEKVKSLVRLMASPGCSSVAVKWQQFNPTAPPPVQAPSQLHALFSDCHTLIYGFVPHCTQAALFGDLSGQEIKTMVSTTELQKTKGTFLHKLTARAIIRDYEDGNLSLSEAEHEEKKAELKSYIIDLSKEFSILSQFTSFVAIEERDQEQPDLGFTDVPKLIAEEDVDILPYMDWDEEKQKSAVWDEELDEYSYMDGCKATYFDQSSSSEDMDFGTSIDCVSQSFSKRYSSKEHSMRSALFSSEDISYFMSSDREEIVPQAAEYTESIGQCFKAVDLSCELESASLSVHRTRDEESVCQDKAAPVFGSGFHKLVFNSSEPHSFGSSSRPSPLQSAQPHIQPVADKAHDAPCAPVLENAATFQSDFRLFPCNALRLLPSPPTAKPAPVFGSGFHKLVFNSSEPHSFGSSSRPSPSAALQSAQLHIQPVADKALYPSFFKQSLFAPKDALLSSITSPSPPPARHAAAAPLTGAPLNLSYSVASSRSSVITAHDAPYAPVLGNAATFQSDFRPFPCSAFSFSLPPTAKAATVAPPPPPPSGCLPLIPPLADTYDADCSYMSTKFPPPPPAVSPPPTSGTAVKKSLPIRGGISFRDGRPPPRRYHVSPSSTLPSAPKGLEDGESRFEIFCYQPKSPSSSPGLFPIQHQQSTQRSERAMGVLSSTQKASKIMRTDKINWDELFNLQQQEGYWECTGALSRFLGLDVDFFANVFLKEKGICSLGVKAHTDILRLVATLLVLQLIRVMKLVEGKLLQSLFHLTDSAQPRPARWEAVKKAVDWACRADRQYPCVYSRLEFGWNWESCTRQLLGLDSLPPCSALAPVLQRSTGLTAM